jgi:serine/threonine protein kinase
VPSNYQDSSTFDTERATDGEITKGLSIQYLIEDVVRNQCSFLHFFFHAIGFCQCRDVVAIARLGLVNFIYFTPTYRDGRENFDRFHPMEQDFVKKKTLSSTGAKLSTTDCVIMQHLKSRRVYAFKIVTKQISLIKMGNDILSNEAFHLLRLLQTNIHPHPNIIRLFNSYTSDAIRGIPLHILQLEYCTGGTLHDLNIRCITSGNSMSTLLITHIFTQLIEALAYLHHGIILDAKGKILRKYLSTRLEKWRPIIHNDINPENILIRWRVRIESRNKTTKHYPDMVLANFDVAGTEGLVLGPRGTYRYSAPEVRQSFKLIQTSRCRLDFGNANYVKHKVVCTPKSDIWSLGAVMEELFFAPDRPETSVVPLDWRVVETMYTLELVTWVRRCLGDAPLGRPSARILLDHAVKEVEESVRVVGDDEESLDLPFWVRAEE